MHYGVEKSTGILRLGDVEIRPGMTITEFRSSVSYGEYDEYQYMNTFWLKQKISYQSKTYRVRVDFQYGKLTSIGICNELNSSGSLEQQNLDEQRKIFKRIRTRLIGLFPRRYFWGEIMLKPIGDIDYCLEIKYYPRSST